ncbi:MAG: dihydroneopterin aldolase [Turicibacter sp.]|nr:dihydroneopterin aldolase [Turicibacter sp.]
MGKIFLNDMIFSARHGVCPHEHEFDQKFKVAVTLKTSAVEEAGACDDLVKTINYALVYDVVQGIMLGEHRQLIETLAYSIGTQILNAFEKVDSVKVKVVKLAPPIQNFNGTAAVEAKVKRHG